MKGVYLFVYLFIYLFYNLPIDFQNSALCSSKEKTGSIIITARLQRNKHKFVSLLDFIVIRFEKLRSEDNMNSFLVFFFCRG